MGTTRKRKLPLRTSRQRTKLLQSVASGMNVSEAGRAAGYSNPQSAHRSLHRIRLQLPEILEKMNLPVEKVIKKLAAKMEAKETKFFEHGGIVMETRNVEAHDIQLRAAIEFAKIYGLYPKTNGHNEENADSGEGTTININLGFLSPERAEAVFAAARERVCGGNSEQPILDAAPDQDQGRTGPEKPV
jgi:hypothetical protein